MSVPDHSDHPYRNDDRRDEDLGENADAFDRLRRRVLWSMPSGLYVVGSRHGDRRNGMTLNWATQVSMEPKQIGIGVTKNAFTHELIEAGKCFSLNLLHRDDRAVVRKFVKPVTVDTDARTLNGFSYRDGISGAPILEHATAFLDCRLTAALDVGDHTLFVGEIVDCGFQGEEGAPVLRMEDTRMNYGG
jgi:flavin reductase (DIM6/NTAB) family NADH-FMN oxidoreductase RutF